MDWTFLLGALVGVIGSCVYGVVRGFLPMCVPCCSYAVRCLLGRVVACRSAIAACGLMGRIRSGIAACGLRGRKRADGSHAGGSGQNEPAGLGKVGLRLKLRCSPIGRLKGSIWFRELLPRGTGWGMTTLGGSPGRARGTRMSSKAAR